MVSIFLPVLANAQTQMRIDGAGATFPFPLIDLWRVKYTEKHPNISVNYQSIGSGGGVTQHIGKTVNFAASDAPLTAKEVEQASDSLHIPEVIGGVTVTYNLPEFPQSGLKLTSKNLADIFLGKITKWNDPAIKADNPDVKLPNKEILVAHRSDGSGTTFVFTEYLNIVSPEWHEKVGFGKTVPWPAGVGAAGNEGVANVVKSTPYGIGYVELAYVIQNKMPYAYLQNADKTAFIAPSTESFADAAAGASSKLPKAHESWEGISINNAPGPNSYPITSFTYIVLHQNLETVTKSKEQALETINFIKYMITDGQQYATSLNYVPIPDEVTKIGLDGLSRVTYNGEKLLSGIVQSKESLPTPSSKQDKVPAWIKNNAGWWAEKQIGDSDFLSGLQFMIQQKIILVSGNPSGTNQASSSIPEWIRNNAGWWSDDLISEAEFVKSLEFLINNGIIKV
ncbi:MAG TPA: phosphate ABC transporter substrate-binding protein PstS [Nitrosopumilaceae archaeon]|nr:phosphate ABC transporter substrate-binding protein PstS [Nitrosopumilaceae archaeon]